MGRPSHYSTDIPERCQDLIALLIKHVEADSDTIGKWGGPLKTTFLLAMATPMIVLPIERIFMPAMRPQSRVADDTALDPRLDARVDDLLGVRRPFESAPFFERGMWHLVAHCDPFNIAGHWPPEILETLNSAEAEKCARAIDTADFLLALRNSLAHGGITYLDRNGRQTEFATNMLAFASWVRVDNSRRLRLLRVSVTAFQSFLNRWTDWLTRSGVANELSNHGPGYFQDLPVAA
jgi:hypothetical protein